MTAFENRDTSKARMPVLSYPKLFHNLKAAIKEVCTSENGRHIFYDDVEISGKEMVEIIEEKNFMSRCHPSPSPPKTEDTVRSPGTQSTGL